MKHYQLSTIALESLPLPQRHLHSNALQWQPPTTHSPQRLTIMLLLQHITPLKNKEDFVSATNAVQLKILLPLDSACAVAVYVLHFIFHFDIGT